MNSSALDLPARTLPSKILIAVDLSAAARHAIAYTCNIVAPGAQVHLVSIAENPRTLVPTGSFVRAALDEARAELLRDADAALAEARDAFAACNAHVDMEAIDLSKHGGDIAHALIDVAQAWGAELIVVGAHQRHGLMRWVEGTVSAPLARLARCPILVVPTTYSVKPAQLPERILFAVDGSDQATQALRYGVRFAAPDTSLRAIYVIDRAVRLSDLVPIDTLEDAFIEEGMHALSAAKPILESASNSSSTRLVKTERTRDDVAHTIAREAVAWEADLIVMGTHGRRGMARWMLGSVAERVARLVQSPLLLVHASERTPTACASSAEPGCEK